MTYFYSLTNQTTLKCLSVLVNLLHFLLPYPSLFVFFYKFHLNNQTNLIKSHTNTHATNSAVSIVSSQNSLPLPLKPLLPFPYFAKHTITHKHTSKLLIPKQNSFEQPILRKQKVDILLFLTFPNRNKRFVFDCLTLIINNNYQTATASGKTCSFFPPVKENVN